MLWMLPVTLIVFFAVRKVAQKINSPLFNPLVFAVIILIGLLLTVNVGYTEYAHNVNILNQLLPYSVVALAYPLYELISQIRARWRSILFITLSASIVAMISGSVIAFLLGAPLDIVASIMPKSVTTPIAVTIAEKEGGIPSIAAFCVIFVGALGAIIGHTLLNLFRVKHSAARGLAIGSASHAVGTARCMEVNYHEGAYSSLALVLCGILTSLIAPFLYPVILMICQWLS